jgi:formylglycine-generating enzyme required for sulfatase activity
LQVTLLDDTRVKPLLRAAAGRTLAKLGDPREAALRPEKMEFCFVPAGPFIMGTRAEDIPTLKEKFGGEQEWYEWETPQHQRDLPAFYIARYPVTNAQFQAFVEAGGYREPRYWVEAEAIGRWKDGKIKRRYYIQDEKGEIKLVEGEEGDAPVDYGEPFNLPNHPVVGVSWYEALAFTRWLTDKLRDWPETPEPLAHLLRDEKWSVTLPSEAQWEKAARGGFPSPVQNGAQAGAEGGGRIFPWGDDPDPNRANYSDTGIGATSAVGCFPTGASPYGVLDLAGNVWEWCATKWQDSYGDYRNDSSFEGDFPRVLRGGAFYGNGSYVRCASRYWSVPDFRRWDFGFRVVVASPL